LIDVEAADLRRMCDVNIVGASLGMKHAFRTMRPSGPAGKGGAIVSVSSVAATIAFPGIAGYSATKSVVDRLTRVAATNRASSVVACASIASIPALCRPTSACSSPATLSQLDCIPALKQQSAT
jgi:NAD(P)-dependent dehydrogenase (short-subunit alcohol dehydrogenase family)